MREEEDDPPTQMSEDDVRCPPLDHGGNSTEFCDETRNCSSLSGYGSSSIDLQSPYPDQVLENVLENVQCFLTCRRDRNAVSLVCKSWYRVEALTRSEVFIGNCYAVSARRVTARFPHVRSVIIKGKPRFSDFSLMPANWGAYFTPWISTMATAYPWLEKVYLKRMTVKDGDLTTIAQSLPGFKELVLVCCEGFGTSGLAVVVTMCRQLRFLELIDTEVVDDDVDWISCFPEGQTCLESLIFDCMDCFVNFEALVKLVARSPLRKLRLNRHVSIGQLSRLMVGAPQLTHLGTGSFSLSEDFITSEQDLDYVSAFSACKSLVCLSGFREIEPDYLPAIYPVCANLTSLNFSFANINAEQLKPVICHCHKLRNFWMLDSVGDEGLQAVAANCKELRELRVFPVDPQEDIEGLVSDIGLQAISEGCRKLQSILYFCTRMTNTAIIAMSKNCPDLIVFRLCIMGIHLPDHVTGQPMDEGFGAIVRNCKKLTRLAVSGLLTDQVFNYIGKYGKLIRTLSVAFAGDSDMALKYVLEGCPKLQKLEIRDSPFGDMALRSGLEHYYNMRFLWMSKCHLTEEGCREIAQAMPGLVVEVMTLGEEVPPSGYVDTLYMYRSLDGPRDDTPDVVHIL